jgi:hypothetical protein
MRNVLAIDRNVRTTTASKVPPQTEPLRRGMGQCVSYLVLVIAIVIPSNRITFAGAEDSVIALLTRKTIEDCDASFRTTQQIAPSSYVTWRSEIRKALELWSQCKYSAAILTAQNARKTVEKADFAQSTKCVSETNLLIGALFLESGDYYAAHAQLINAIEFKDSDELQQKRLLSIAFHVLGNAELDRSDCALATKYLDKASILSIETVGVDDVNTLSILLDRLRLSIRIGDLKRAISLCDEFEQSAKKSDVSSLRGRFDCSRGVLALRNGDFARSVRLLENAYQIECGISSLRSVNSMSTLLNLGTAELADDNFAAAEGHAAQAIKTIKECLGEDHPLCLRAERLLARVAMEEGNAKLAVERMDVAHTHQSKARPNDKWAVAEDLELTAQLATWIKDYNSASKWLKESSATYSFCGDNLSCCWTRCSLARVYYLQKDYEHACNLYLEQFKLLDKMISKSHPLFLREMRALAVVARDAGMNETSITILRRVIDSYSDSSPSRKWEYAAAETELAISLIGSHQETEAEALLKKALKHSSAMTPESRRIRASVMLQLGLLCAKRHDLTAAKGFVDQCTNIIREEYGENDVNYANALYQQSRLALAANDFHQAETTLQKSIQIVENSCGRDSIQLVGFLRAYSYTMKKVGNDEIARDNEKRANYIEQLNARISASIRN